MSIFEIFIVFGLIASCAATIWFMFVDNIFNVDVWINNMESKEYAPIECFDGEDGKRGVGQFER